MGRGLHTVLVRRRAPLPNLVRALLRHAGVGFPCGRDPRGSRRLGALGRAVCRSSRIPPPPRVAVPSGEGGASPRLRGGGPSLLWLPSLGGGSGGGGWGGCPPASPPRRASACHPLCPACPPRGILVPWGLPGGRGRWARSGRPPTGQCGGGGGGLEGGGTFSALVRAPVFPGPASDRAAPFAPSWALPVRRRPAAGRACGRLPRPWRPRTPGAAASSGAVLGRRFFGLPPSALGPEWQGGGGASGPLAPPPDSRGGGGMAVPAPGASHRLGGRTLPPPPSTQSQTLVQALAGAPCPPRRRRAALAGRGRP